MSESLVKRVHSFFYNSPDEIAMTKKIQKRIFMGWVNTKPKHPEDHYTSSSITCSPGPTWHRVYSYIDENTTLEEGTGLSKCFHCGGLMNESQRYVCGCDHCKEQI